MAALVVELADEVSAYLNGQTINGERIASVRRLIPEKTLAEAKTLQTVIVPNSLESKFISRDHAERLARIEIGVMRRAKETELESLLDLTQKIGDLLEGHRFTTGICVRIKFDPIYDVNSWQSLHSFVAVVVAEIKVV